MRHSLVFFCNKVFSCWISKLKKWCVSSCSLVRNSEVLFGPFSATDGTCEWKVSYLGQLVFISYQKQNILFFRTMRGPSGGGAYTFSLLSIGWNWQQSTCYIVFWRLRVHGTVGIHRSLIGALANATEVCCVCVLSLQVNSCTLSWHTPWLLHLILFPVLHDHPVISFCTK